MSEAVKKEPRLKTYYVGKEWIPIPYSRHGYYDWRVRSKNEFYDSPRVFKIKAYSIDEAKEKWKKVDSWTPDYSEVIKKLYPYAEVIFVNMALQENFSHRGIVFDYFLAGEPLTRDVVYAVYVAHLRHTETDYDRSVMKGDGNRELWNEHLHEDARIALGIDREREEGFKYDVVD